MAYSPTIQVSKPLNIFQRIADNDQTAAKDCVIVYGKFIWALAKKFTSSREEAEAAAQEIFHDIWRYSRDADKAQSAEAVLVSQIARRRLIGYLQ
jgi:DNA-directed RNA polymerase specialized sigma24 family protein